MGNEIVWDNKASVEGKGVENLGGRGKIVVVLEKLFIYFLY